MSKFHKVEINFPVHPGPDFMLKVDGVTMKAVAGVVIKSAFASGHNVPTVEITLLADNVKGKVKGKVEMMIIPGGTLDGAGKDHNEIKDMTIWSGTGGDEPKNSIGE